MQLSPNPVPKNLRAFDSSLSSRLPSKLEPFAKLEKEHTVRATPSCIINYQTNKKKQFKYLMEKIEKVRIPNL